MIQQFHCETVGVLGGGQLGRMMVEASHRLGIKVIVLDPQGSESPAGQIACSTIQGSFNDEEKIMELAKVSDVITVEIEHVNVNVLEKLEKKGVRVCPSATTLRTIQDKYIQKCFFRDRGIATPWFLKVDHLDDAYAAGEKLGYPFMLKSRLLAYDGKGNFAVMNKEQVPEAVTQLKSGFLYAEEWIHFSMELAVMVVHGQQDVKSYPVVETTQKENVCSTVLAPAQISQEIYHQATALALECVRHFDGIGIYGVELFLTKEGQVLINEIAPRPHNSGHYTMEACETDQFENHLRAVLALPLGSCDLRVGASLMFNVLGDPTGDPLITYAPLQKAYKIPGAAIHFYGKKDVLPGRKLAHLTIVASSMKELIHRSSLLELSSYFEEIIQGINITTEEKSQKNPSRRARRYRNNTKNSNTKNKPQKNNQKDKTPRRPLVSIIMGSDSDLPCMQAAANVLIDFDVPYELTIVSAHRTPKRMYEYTENAPNQGIRVIIAGAGGAAHLPGMVAALTHLPVIGVPIKTSTLNGQDSLLSIVQMPRGIPVATVAIGNATNAGLLAVRILSLEYPNLADKMQTFMKEQEKQVVAKVDTIREIGWSNYLAQMNLN